MAVNDMSAPVRLLRCARIRTMAPARGPQVVDALAVSGERVVAAGPLAELRERFAGAPETDLGGGCALPGFVDAHIHLTMAARNAVGVDVAADVTGSEDRLAARLRSAAVPLPAGAWLRASRYDQVRTTGGRVIDRDDLDRWVPDRPVLVVHVGAHWGVVNSAALAAAGLTDDSPDPHGGALGRDGSGRLNGVLYEQALFDLAYPSLARRRPVVPAPSEEELLAGLDTASDMFLSAGITSVGDAMVGPDELRLLQTARTGGRLRQRVNALVTYPHVDHLIAAGIRDGFGDDWLRLGGVKAFVDGAVAGLTCWLSEPFRGTDDHGMAVVSREELTDLALRVHGAGLRLAAHANGDRAIALLLDALEHARRRHPHITTRHRIEHCSVVDETIVKRIAALDLIPVPFAGYVAFHGDALVDAYGEERLGRMFAHRRLLDAGITVAGSSDYPCGPYEPLLGVQSCVTRRTSGGRVLGERQRISTGEALALFGTGAAAAAGEEGAKGRLAPGYLADLVVLAADPFEVPPDELGRIPVTQTWVGGVPAWTADGAR
ncbi:amidohydrolase [Sphaerimonospora mesophila]|uniref:amidohydrolase n=1 Tax=Sphaerimonospora mesophila TaxID=37483 RepID=UPI000AB1C57E